MIGSEGKAYNLHFIGSTSSDLFEICCSDCKRVDAFRTQDEIEEAMKVAPWTESGGYPRCPPCSKVYFVYGSTVPTSLPVAVLVNGQPVVMGAGAK